MAKKYELVGGLPVEVEPLEATQAGTYKAPLGKAYNPVTVSASGAQLPEVTSDDNGDVLTVVDGAWAKAAPSGGSDLFVIDVTFVDDTPTINKTFSEVMTAYEAGKYPMLRNAAAGAFVPMQSAGASGIEFTGYAFSPPTNLGVLHFVIGNDNLLSMSFYSFTLTPGQ